MTQALQAPARTRAQIAGRTLRTDPWRKAPRVTAALLTIWVTHATVHVLTGHRYCAVRHHYLTPFFSPRVSGERVQGSSSPGHWAGAAAPVIPYALVPPPLVPGLPVPSCNSWHAFYRAPWRVPAACAVREPHSRHPGETGLPLIMQNLHRCFPRLVIVISVLSTCAWRRRSGRAGRELRLRPGLADHDRECGPAEGTRSRAAPAGTSPAAGGTSPGTRPGTGLDEALLAERAAHAARADHARHADAPPCTSCSWPAGPSQTSGSSTRNGLRL
jgi:hypothetical protein